MFLNSKSTGRQGSANDGILCSALDGHRIAACHLVAIQCFKTAYVHELPRSWYLLLLITPLQRQLRPVYGRIDFSATSAVHPLRIRAIEIYTQNG